MILVGQVIHSLLSIPAIAAAFASATAPAPLFVITIELLLRLSSHSLVSGDILEI